MYVWHWKSNLWIDFDFSLLKQMKSYKLIISGPDPTLNYSVSYSDFVSQNKIIEYIQYLTIPFYIYIMLYNK